MNKIKGFTLLELLIVVIIVGILASLAIPQYLKTTEASKATEAYNNLSSVRKAQLAYYGIRQNYTTNFNELSIENPNNIPLVTNGGNRYFAYTSDGTSTNIFPLRATRSGGTYNNNFITMDVNGNISEGNWLR